MWTLVDQVEMVQVGLEMETVEEPMVQEGNIEVEEPVGGAVETPESINAPHPQPQKILCHWRRIVGWQC